MLFFKRNNTDPACILWQAPPVVRVPQGRLKRWMWIKATEQHGKWGAISHAIAELKRSLTHTGTLGGLNAS